MKDKTMNPKPSTISSVKTLHNRLGAIRILDEHIEALTDDLKVLKGQREAYESDILSYLADHPDYFNVHTHKKQSAGILGQEYFEVNYGLALTRRNDMPIDDQKWLADLQGKAVDTYVETRFTLNKNAARDAAIKGVLSISNLRAAGLELWPTAHLSVTYADDPEAIKADIKAAEKTIEENEDTVEKIVA